MMKKIEKIINICGECPYCIPYSTNMEIVPFSWGCNHPGNNKTELIQNIGKILPSCPLENATDLGVKAGVAIFLINDKEEILVGKRKNTTCGEGGWGLPGGRMDRWEDPIETITRETKEETGIIVSNLEFFTYTNDIFKEKNEHWVTLYFVSRQFIGKAKRIEPDKCEEWRWVSIDNIPEPVFCAWKAKLHNIKNKRI